MKKIVLSGVFVLSVMAATAQFVTKGINVTSHGLRIDSVFVVVNHAIVPVESFPSGTKLILDMMGIKGMSIRDDKSFPGISMEVLDQTGKKIINYDDLLKEYPDGVAKERAKQLDVSLTIGAPMTEGGGTYNWRVRVWDKNGKSDIVIEVPVVVAKVHDQLGIKKVQSGLTCKNAYLMDSAPLTSRKMDVGATYFFVLTGLEGFVTTENKVKIGASMSLKDDAGTTVLEYTDLFKDEDTYSVIDSETIRMNLTVGDPMVSGGHYVWDIKVWDKKSAKKIDASVPIEVN